MKTETEVRVQLGEFRAGQNLPLSLAYRLKLFMASSRKDFKPFLAKTELTPIHQTLSICNIAGKQIQLWLCDLSDKIIASAVVSLPTTLNTPTQILTDLNMASTPLGSVNLTLTVSQRQIQKPVFIQADEELLKKVQDPLEKKRQEQEQLRLQRELEEQQLAARDIKKPAITVSQFNKREMPFV